MEKELDVQTKVCVFIKKHEASAQNKHLPPKAISDFHEEVNKILTTAKKVFVRLQTFCVHTPNLTPLSCQFLWSIMDGAGSATKLEIAI